MISTNLRKTISDGARSYRHTKQSIQDETIGLAESERLFVIESEVLQCLRAMAIQTQQKAHNQIAGIVTKCLHSIFDDPYDFNIIFEEKRGKTEARFVLTRNGEDYDPMAATGGGVLDIVGFALRVAVIASAHPKRRRLLVMDEPFKFLSTEYRETARQLIETLAEELDFQFIYVTHIDELVCGTVVSI